jgi:hypothetical protein
MRLLRMLMFAKRCAGGVSPGRFYWLPVIPLQLSLRVLP